MNRIKRLFNHWRYLGYDQETYRKYRYELCFTNLASLRWLSFMALIISCVAAFGILALEYASLRYAMGKLLCIGAFALICAGQLALGSRARHSEARPSYRWINSQTVVVETSCCLIGVAISALNAVPSVAVTEIWLLLLAQVLITQSPLQNLAVVTPCALAFIITSYCGKSAYIAGYDALHASVALLVGAFASWYGARTKLDSLIAHDKLKHVNYALYHSSTTDELTGLDNRKLIFAKLAELQNESIGRERRLNCLVMDIDNFKAYNDLYGHPAGDDLMRAIGRVFHEYADEHGVSVGRIGGEEFMQIWLNRPDLSGETAAVELRARVEALAVPHAASGVESVVTLSVGVYSATPSELSRKDAMYYWADRALYRAKEHGKNCCWRYVDDTRVFERVGAECGSEE